MLVMKFGGSSLADAPRLRQAAALVAKARPEGVLAVLSACGKTTDALHGAAELARGGDLPGAMEAQLELIQLHRRIASDLFPKGVPEALDHALTDLSGELELLLRGVCLLRELSPRSLDAIASIGERLSTQIFAAYLQVDWFDVRGVMCTDDAFGAARPLPIYAASVQRELAPLLNPGSIAVTQGYIGATAGGITTTLGRGGSDYSASLLGAALRVREIQIWTDVEGVLTCDPRVVAKARPIAELSFAEAAELAAFGAKVLHPATVEPAMQAGIPVTVRHTQVPEGCFTTLTEHPATGRPVTALASRGPIVVLTVEAPRMLAQSGFLARIFDVFRRHAVSVDLVSTAEVSVSLTVEEDAPLALLVEELSTFARVRVAEGRTLIAIVGERLKATPGLAARALVALQDIHVEMLSMGANEINLSLVVREEDGPQSLRLLHRALFEEAL